MQGLTYLIYCIVTTNLSNLTTYTNNDDHIMQMNYMMLFSGMGNELQPSPCHGQIISPMTVNIEFQHKRVNLNFDSVGEMHH